jgi:putative methionine-R-sulfoxide reductase with GAF domain
MNAKEAVQGSRHRPLAGSIKNQYYVLILGSVIITLLVVAGLAVISIDSLGKTAMDIDKMAAVEPFVMNQIQEAMTSNLRTFIIYRVVPVSVLILGVIFVVGMFWINRVVNPLEEIIENSQSIRGEGLADFPKEAPGEVGLLSKELTEMISHLRLRQELLENHNFELLQDKEKNSTQLIATGHLAREITIVHQLDNLLTRTVNLIRDRFKYYHVSIFMMDPGGQFAVLRAASGDAGRKMLAMNHRLKVAQSSIVGYVASTGLSRMVPDVEGDTTYFRNPLLPDTRSEVALPLHISQRTIGVLDIHSNKPEVFNEEDILVLQTMADQISVAIDKAHWFQLYQETLERLDLVSGREGSKKFISWLPSNQMVGFAYDLKGVKPLERVEDANQEEQIPGTLVSLPLSVRGEVIAKLDLWSEKEALSVHEESFVEEILARLSQAIESAQLFEDTQVRERRERVLNQFVSNLSNSMDLDALLQQAVKELAKMPNVNEVSIVIQPPDETVGSPIEKKAEETGIEE